MDTNAIQKPLIHILFLYLDPPQQNIYLPQLSPSLLFDLYYSYWKQGPLTWPTTFFYGFGDEKHQKNRCSHVPFMLSDIILTQWRHPVASSEALDLLHWAMCAVTYRRITMAIKTASKLGVFVDCCLFACCPGGRRGNTKQVVAQWRRPVASKVALDMPHWVMPLYCLGAPLWPSTWLTMEVHLFIIVNPLLDTTCS